jgi:hypothetical protein
MSFYFLICNSRMVHFSVDIIEKFTFKKRLLRAYFLPGGMEVVGSSEILINFTTLHDTTPEEYNVLKILFNLLSSVPIILIL